MWALRCLEEQNHNFCHRLRTFSGSKPQTIDQLWVPVSELFFCYFCCFFLIWKFCFCLLNMLLLWDLGHHFLSMNTVTHFNLVLMWTKNAGTLLCLMVNYPLVCIKFRNFYVKSYIIAICMSQMKYRDKLQIGEMGVSSATF